VLLVLLNEWFFIIIVLIFFLDVFIFVALLLSLTTLLTLAFLKNSISLLEDKTYDGKKDVNTKVDVELIWH
jgi:hypothetical protein